MHTGRATSGTTRLCLTCTSARIHSMASSVFTLDSKNASNSSKTSITASLVSQTTFPLHFLILTFKWLFVYQISSIFAEFCQRQSKTSFSTIWPVSLRPVSSCIQSQKEWLCFPKFRSCASKDHFRLYSSLKQPSSISSTTQGT